jgi:hypothetical protein
MLAFVFMSFVVTFGVAGTFLSIEAKRRYDTSAGRMRPISEAQIRLGRVVREAD